MQWNAIGYYGLSLENALNAYVRMKIRDKINKEKIKSVQQLIQEIKKLENKIKDNIKQSNIVVRVKNNEIA